MTPAGAASQPKIGHRQDAPLLTLRGTSGSTPDVAIPASSPLHFSGPTAGLRLPEAPTHGPKRLNARSLPNRALASAEQFDLAPRLLHPYVEENILSWEWATSELGAEP
jgi:hypothetical protein